LIDLDDPRALDEADPAGMLKTVLSLPEQCAAGYLAGRDAENLPSVESMSSVVVCGMGGSGIAGDILAALYRDRLGVPIVPVKNPVLPEFAGKDAIVVCSSYSGTTAETLACFEQAADRGCRLVALCSGGPLARRAEDQDFAVVRVPAGVVAPRAAVGHLAFGLLGALEAMGALPPLRSDVAHCARDLEGLSAQIAPDVPRRENPAKDAAATIGDRVPVVWGAEGIGTVVASRWKTQFNENAKVPAFSSSLPELDHNEVVGWAAGTGDRFFLVTLRHGHEHPDVASRFEVSIDVVLASGLGHREVRVGTGSPLGDLMRLVMLGDATSVYLGYLRSVDPAPIEAIARIKRAVEGPSS
jgi:glucose/mannose-6-phosphate isomerase